MVISPILLLVLKPMALLARSVAARATHNPSSGGRFQKMICHKVDENKMNESWPNDENDRLAIDESKTL